MLCSIFSMSFNLLMYNTTHFITSLTSSVQDGIRFFCLYVAFNVMQQLALADKLTLAYIKKCQYIILLQFSLSCIHLYLDIVSFSSVNVDE